MTEIPTNPHPGDSPSVVPVGLYPDIPEDVYHREWDYASQSRLTKLARGWPPAKLRWAIDHADDKDDSDDTALGTALHTRVLRPNLYKDTISFGPINPSTGKMFGRDSLKFLAWREENPGLTVIGPEDQDAIEGMAASLLALPAFKALVDHPDTMREVSLRTDWELDEGDQTYALHIKGRLDILSVQAGFTGDVKTTDDASQDAFQRSIYKWGYHHQGASYLQQLADLGIQCKDFGFFVVERKPPHLAACYRLTDDALAKGWAELKQPMLTLAKAYTTGEWPGYPQEIQDIGLPSWAARD